MLLALGTLSAGFILDDYAFVGWLEGTSPRRVTPFDLYEFASGERAENFEMVRRGPWPWWTDLDFKIRFFRPLSSALLFIDHAVLPLFHIERRGDDTLLVTVDPGMLYGSFEVVFRSAKRPLRAGDRVDLDGATVNMLKADDGHPTSFEVVFRTPSIDDPSLLFLIWQDGKLAPVQLLPGERIDVPWSPGPTGFF
jgi:hypothetical protein